MKLPIKILRQVVSHLAQEARAQVAYLQRLGSAPSADELALELNDLLPFLPELVEAGKISPGTAAKNQELDRLSGPENQAIWRVTALDTAPEWQVIRSMARLVLNALTIDE